MREYMSVYNVNDEKIERSLYRKGVEEGLIKKRNIYNSLFNLVRKHWEVLNNLGCRVGYAYLEVGKDTYLRTVILILNGKAIDMNRHFYKSRKESYYYVYKIDTIQEYMTAVVDEQGDIGLKVYLEDEEVYWNNYAFRNYIDLKE